MPHAKTIQVVTSSLTETFSQLDTLFDLPAELCAYHPTAEAWSIDEILEYISLTSHYLLFNAP